MDQYLTVQEVAELLRCEHRTVRRAIKSGELDAALIGGRWLVRPDSVDEWFEARRAASGSAGRITDVARARPRISARADRPGSVARLQAIERS